MKNVSSDNYSSYYKFSFLQDEKVPKKTSGEESDTFNIVSWNVAGLHAAVKKDLCKSVIDMNPDVMCLQETKTSLKKQPPPDIAEKLKAMIEILSLLIFSTIFMKLSYLNYFKCKSFKRLGNIDISTTVLLRTVTPVRLRLMKLYIYLLCLSHFKANITLYFRCGSLV